MSIPELKTRRPTGLPPHPLLLIAGVEKAGKSYAGAAFSSSDLIDRTFWIEIGEGAADQYGAIPGARYEIVEHDGTYASIATSVEAATLQPRDNGRPHAIVIDSITELWDLLSDSAQLKANARAKAKAEKANRPIPAEDVQITMDLWNDAKKKWRRILELLRTYDGPVILLARLEMVAVMGADGKPTTDREWKIRAEKNLPYECDAIVKMTAPQQAVLTGVRSTVLQVPPGRELPLPQFTIDELLRRMGVAEVGATAPRSYTAPKATVDDADAPMQRQAPRAEDEWNTATGQPLAPPSPAMPSPTVDEINEIVRLLGVKRGVYNGQCAPVVSQLVKRRIDDPGALSQAEARSIIETLTAENDFVPATPGTPNEPVIGKGAHRQMQALFKEAGITDRDGQHAFIQRVLRLDEPLKSRNDLNLEQFKLVRHALSTGDVPPAEEPPGPNANGEGISEFDALDQMIWDVNSQQTHDELQQAITVEVGRGAISASDAGILRERLAAHVAQAKAGAAA